MLINRKLFPIPHGTSYLDTAAEGLPPLTTEAALSAYWQVKRRGTPGRVQLYEEQKQAESAAARLLQTDPDNVVLLANSSEALNLLAHSIEWQPGDEVLICDLEFPSNVVVWLQLKRRGVNLIVVPSIGGVVELEDWTSRLSLRTRIVSVSQVSYKTGTQIPYLQELAAKAHSLGALFCVDATQALGRVPVSVESVDYLVASTYKWILGTHGLGITYCSPGLRARFVPGTAGWYSAENLFHAERFETYTPKSTAGQLQAGMPNFPAIYALRPGLECLLGVGVERIDRELRPLVAALRNGLVEQRHALLTPSEPRFASGIVSFAWRQAEQLGAALAKHGVTVWAGDGRVRMAIHLYNDEEDVDRCLSAIRLLTLR